MYDVIAQHLIKAGGVNYSAGEVVPIESEEEAQRLVDVGAAQWARGEDVEEGAAPDLDGGIEEEEGEEGTLPADIPGRAKLVAAGITSIEQLLDVPDLTSIDGVGEGIASQIETYLAYEPEA